MVALWRDTLTEVTLLAQRPSWTKGAACKAVIAGFDSPAALQFNPTQSLVVLVATLSGVRLIRTKESLNRLLASGSVPDDQRSEIVARLDDIEAQINGAGVCHRCGRPLKDRDARYGPECQLAIEATQTEET